MQRHSVTFHIDAPRATVWRNLHPVPPEGATHPRIVEYPGGRIEVLFEGDAAGEGLVRTCTFRVPKLIGGRARSWECVVEARAEEYSRYMAVGKPIWSHAEGWQELADAPEGGTLVTFTETYEIYNRLLRPLEGWIHRFISRDNNEFFEVFLGRSGAIRRVT
ncbi:MAG: hypothetical protein JWO68_1444 [Actinomycetia bacterium]|nr:hypothetical protein [Actinomycetes bacterium]